MSKAVTAFDPYAFVPGSTVGPWLMLERMDSGSFGIVFRACRAGQPDSPPVVVKIAKQPRDPRFEREGELLQHCPHPSIPRFEDAGDWTSPEGHCHPYVVMELVEGFTLYAWFRARQRTSREVLQVLAQVAGALATAHARGAVHRDVKGDNIRVTSEGRAVLVDWGSGWFPGASPLTDTTAPPGTTVYRPPEQRFFSWRFRMDLDARWQAQPTDDLYSLGVAFYRMVTGIYLPPLSEGGDVAATREVPPPSDYATLSRDLEALIRRLLSNESKQRGTAEALAREAAALATAAGEAADMPILPTDSAQPTDRGFRPDFSSSGGREDEEVLSDTDSGQHQSSSSTTNSAHGSRSPSPGAPDWLTWALASMVGGLVVALVMVLVMLLVRPAHQEDSSPAWIAAPEEVAQFAPDAGVSEEALSTIQEVPGAVVPRVLAIGRPMPSKPFPGQKKPPCEPHTQRVINGACWVGPIRDAKPPCGHEAFDGEDGCYVPIFPSPREPASEEP